MPSPRRTLSSSSTSESTNDKQDVTDIPKPLWNSAPNELPPFLIKLGEWLMQDAACAHACEAQEHYHTGSTSSKGHIKSFHEQSLVAQC